MNLIGTTLGAFQIVEEIGQGGMSRVYRAYQPGLERWVAVKVLQLAPADGTQPLRRFRREARAIATLRHPNILTVYDYGEERGLAYIAMEYVPGGSLEKRLSEHPGQSLEWPVTAELVIPIGKALAFAHSQEIIHRDVKPANVLLGHHDWPLLADFGLVKVSRPRRKITSPGIGLGTPFYTAPEQILGEAVDHRADIYALGMTLYEMLTGQKPFSGSTPGEMLIKRLNENPVAPGQINPDIPPDVEQVVLCALARDPDERYSTMDEFVAAMELNQPNILPIRGGCPACGATVDLSKAYCSKCGAPLKSASAQPPKPVATTRLSQAQPLSQGPRLTIPSTGATFALPAQPVVLVGRGDPSNPTPPDIDLSYYGGGQSGVSRYHAKLFKQDQHWFVEDLDSTNGTFINERPLAPRRPMRLRDGDAVRFGQMTLIFYHS